MNFSSFNWYKIHVCILITLISSHSSFSFRFSLILILNNYILAYIKREEPLPRESSLLAGLQIIRSPLARHNLAYALPPRPLLLHELHIQLLHYLLLLALLHSLRLLHSPSKLESIDSGRVLDDTADLVVEHDHHEDAEEECEHEGKYRDHELCRLCEEETVLVVAGVALPADQDEGVGAAEEDVEQEEQEVLLVVVADAVVDPRAVVVHPRDATFAGRTVVTLRYFDCVALLAPSLQYGFQLGDFLRLQ